MLSRLQKQRLYFAAIVGTLLVVMALEKAPGAPAPSKSVVKVGAIPLSSAARALRSAAAEKRFEAEYRALIGMYREPPRLLKNITLTASDVRVTSDIGERYVTRSQVMQRADKNAYRVLPDTSTLLADIGALRLQQRADIRSALTKEQRVQFDKNVAIEVANRVARAAS